MLLDQEQGNLNQEAVIAVKSTRTGIFHLFLTI